MKINVLETSPATRTLEIEVPVERVAEEMKEHWDRLARRAKLPGFRQGKVPRPILEKNFSAQVQQEVLEHLLPQATFEAIKESKLEVVGQPQVEGLKFEPTAPMQFKAVVEIKPAFELSGPLTGLKVKASKHEVSDAQVDEQLQRIAEGQAVVGAPHDKPAKKGDHVVVDFAGTIEGKPFEGGKSQSFPIELGAGRMLPEFEQSLYDQAAGSKVTAQVNFPPEYQAKEVAGKKAEFTIHVKEVRERQVPAINDELAKQVGEFANLDKLKERIRESLSAQVKAEKRSTIVEQIANQLVQKHDIQPPKVMLEGEFQYLLDRERRNLQSRGLEVVDEEKLKTELQPLASNRVKLSLVLSKLAEREKLSISDEEYRAEMGRLAPGMGMSVPEVIRWVDQTGRESGIKQKLLEDKAMNWLVEKAEVTES
jgi:trigger factor